MMRAMLRGALCVLVLLVLASAVPVSASPATATSSLTARKCGHFCIKVDGQGLMPDSFVSISYTLPSGPVAQVDFDHPIGADGEYHVEWQIGAGVCQPTKSIGNKVDVGFGAIAADGTPLSDSVVITIKFC
jgi:hypothetical protein